MVKSKIIKSSSPILLNDLAVMEKYIAESYMGRSLIELLQNADDANSTKFYINKLKNNTYLIANNGREFTEKDLYALCRSGASTKRRKPGTIGFRGIGFKSVVNYAKTVHLISGDIKATFSRDKTKNKLWKTEGRKTSNISKIVTCFDGKEKLSWLVFSCEKNKPCDITFCFIGKPQNILISESIG